MAVKIRLTRMGAKKRPFYRIVAADARVPRDGKYLENLGTYNPLLKKDDQNRVKLNKERVDYWISVGAQPTDTVAKFLQNLDVKFKPRKRVFKPIEKKAEEAVEKIEETKTDAEKVTKPEAIKEEKAVKEAKPAKVVEKAKEVSAEKS